jgi:predicted Zn-dependent peptidase
VLGSQQSITAMPREVIAAYHERHYQPSNVVLAAAGNLEHDRVLELVTASFPDRSEQRPSRPPATDTARASVLVDSRDTEQTHVVVGMRALPALDDDRYALTVVNQALGGGMSSRLFQEIREQRGLAYSVYSYRAAYEDTGFMAVYAGSAPDRVAETLDVIDTELARLCDEGLPDEQVDAAKGHLTGSLGMSLETSASRMRRIGRSELVEGEIPTLAEIMQRIDSVTRDDIARAIHRVFVSEPRALAVVGPHQASDFPAFATV